MTVHRIQETITELERQVTRLRAFLVSYKRGELDFDELASTVTATLEAVRNVAEAQNQRRAA